MLTDKELVKFTTEFRRGLLGRRGRSHRKCFMVCAPLMTLLNREGVRCELRQSTVYPGVFECEHIWIRLADGRVLDPTADQFNEHFGRQMPKVYLGKPAKYLHGNNVSRTIGGRT